MELLPLSNFIEHQNEFVTINDNQEYIRVTAKLHRKGLVLRDIAKGFEIKTKKQQICKTDQLLVAEIDAKVGGYGIVPKELEGAIVSSHYFLFNINSNELLSRYLGYVLKTDEFFSQIKAQGSTNYASIRPKDIGKIKIPYCNVDVQRKIVEKLDSITAKNNHLSNNILRDKDHISKLRQAILQEAVSGKLVPQDPNDEPASELLKKIKAEKEKMVREGKIRKEKKLPPITEEEKTFTLPKGWIWVRFGQITICRDGERIPVSKEERKLKSKIYDYYGASGIIDKIDDYIFDKELLLIGEDGANLINRSTPIAFLAKGKYWVNNHAHVLDAISPDILRFLEVHINAIDLKPYITGTAQPKMNQAKMNSIVIALPPLSEQGRIIQKVNQLIMLCNKLQEKIKENQNNSELLMEAVLKEAFAS